MKTVAQYVISVNRLLSWGPDGTNSSMEYDSAGNVTSKDITNLVYKREVLREYYEV